MRFLVEAGANKDQPTTEDESTPLQLAVEKGHLAVVRFLVESGADIDRTTQSGKTALDVALEHGHQEIGGFLASLQAKEPPRKIRRRDMH